MDVELLKPYLRFVGICMAQAAAGWLVVLLFVAFANSDYPSRSITVTWLRYIFQDFEKNFYTIFFITLVLFLGRQEAYFKKQKQQSLKEVLREMMK